jgi:hypothetical protein
MTIAAAPTSSGVPSGPMGVSAVTLVRAGNGMLHHAVKEGVGDIETAGRIHAQHLVPRVAVHLQEGFVAGDSCVVHQNASTGNGGAISKLTERVGRKIKDVDLFEINEAASVLPMAAMN